MSKLKPAELKLLLHEPEKICLVDVRSEDEFASGHLPGSRCVPLEKIEAGHLLPTDKLVVLNCQSGKRSARAREVLLSRGQKNLVELEGGFSAWAEAGLPVNQTRKSIPIMRQVMITAGALGLSGSIMGALVNPLFYVVPGFIGAGLLFAGISGWCGMAFLLEKMPWNRRMSPR